jgi:hypothetical protein
LLINGEARVVRGLGANNLRSAPNSGSELLTQIPEGEIFTIQQQVPVCDAGLIWWNVYYNDLSGWTAEGADGVYWLEPVGSETTAP